MSRLKIQPQEKNTAMQLEELRTSRIIISTLREKKCAFLVCDGRLKSVTVIGSSGINPGDIVIALVKDVKKDIGACFIEYSEGCDGYLPLDKIPTDVTVRQGDLIPVSITADAQKGKRAKFTAKIDYSKIPDGDALKEKAVHLGRFNYLYRSDKYIKDIICKTIQKDEFNLIIDHTEAMTVIDVNSGKYTPSRNKDKESAYLTVNEEAAIEICRQLRLRNLSGIIVVDFINLDDKNDQDSLMELLRAESAKDTQQVTVVDITALGLVEITRKKTLTSLYEQINN